MAALNNDDFGMQFQHENNIVALPREWCVFEVPLIQERATYCSISLRLQGEQIDQDRYSNAGSKPELEECGSQ